MVGCSVDDDDHGGTPSGALAVQLGDELAEEELHHAAVAVGLGQRVVDVTEGVDAQDHGNPRSNRQLRYRVGSSWYLPLLSTEVAHAKPGLVNIEEDFLLPEETQELQRPSLTEDEILWTIAEDRNVLDLVEPHAQLFPQDIPNLLFAQLDHTFSDKR